MFWIHLSLIFSSCSPDKCNKPLPEKHSYSGRWGARVEGRRSKTHCMQNHFRGWEQKNQHRQNSLSVSGELVGTTQVNIWKTKLLSAQHRKKAARSRKKKRVRLNLSMCVHAEKSQKISTNVTIHSGLIYGPQRPRTWLSGLFLCKLWHLRLTSRALYMFWLNICTQLCWWKELQIHTNLREFILPSVCV